MQQYVIFFPILAIHKENRLILIQNTVAESPGKLTQFKVIKWHWSIQEELRATNERKKKSVQVGGRQLIWACS